MESAQPRVLTREHALARGYSRRAIEHRLATGRWRRLLPRTYLTSDTLTDRDKLQAALAYAGPGSALSGAAALREAGVRRIAHPARILVLVPLEVKLAGAEWLEIARTTRAIDVQPFGFRHVPVARAAADLALRTSALDDVRALVARIVRDGHCSLSALGEQLDLGPRRGSAHLRRALTEVGWGAASAPEAKAAAILRRAGIDGFVQNARLRLPDGTTRVFDFYWPELRAVLEIDSAEFHLDPADWRATMDRHLQLTTLGFSVIHRPPSALALPQRFAADVLAWLDGCRARHS